MEKITNSEELRQRLVQAAGEDVIECGWGTLGMGNVLVGVTPSAMVLEFVTLGLRTKEIKRIPFEELEFINSLKGDASTPKLMKMSIESRISDSITGTLVFKIPTEKMMNITFRKIPRFDKNDQAPFRITEFLTSVKPDVVKLPEPDQRREKQSFAGCMRNFLIITGVCSAVVFAVFGFGTGKWDLGVFAGLGTGVILGAVFAPLVPVFKRIISGRG